MVCYNCVYVLFCGLLAYDIRFVTLEISHIFDLSFIRLQKTSLFGTSNSPKCQFGHYVSLAFV